jgi:formate hydrogenlyase subunit 3/multisubunit Na+/H+ antiporter MnhD subunit
MSLTLADLLPALPFGAAALLVCIPSWRAGVRINAAASSLLFVITCLLFWWPSSMLSAHFALLTAFVAMTASWFGWRDIRAALAERRLNRRSAQRHHVALQTLLGAILLAVLSDSPAVTWLAATAAVASVAALTAAVRTVEARHAAGRLLLFCGAGLMLSLFGTLLLYVTADEPAAAWSDAPALSVICLVLGYGGIAGLVPLHSWLPGALAEGTPQAATLTGALLANVPLLVILRLRPAAANEHGPPDAVIIALGLATLLLAAVCLLVRPTLRHSLTFAGTAQLGFIVVAFGLASRVATFAGVVLMTMLTLVRAAAFLCSTAATAPAGVRTRQASIAALAGLPIFAFVLVAEPTAEAAPWLMLPMGLGALVVSGALLCDLRTIAPSRERDSLASLAGLAPVWLQLALVVLLAAAMPGPVVEWFHALAAVR